MWETKWSGSPVVVAHQRHRQVWPRGVPVGVEVALAHPVAGDLAGDQLLEQVEVGLEVVRVGDALEGELVQLFRGVPEHLAQRLVDPHELTFEADQRDAHRRVVDGESPALFSRCKGGHPSTVWACRHRIRPGRDDWRLGTGSCRIGRSLAVGTTLGR